MFTYVGAFPVIDTDITMQVLMGLLGLAGMRTFEKHKGVS
jgi:Tfp pilus assembly protein PilX